MDFDFRRHRINVWNENFEKFSDDQKLALNALSAVRKFDKILGARVNGILSDARCNVKDGDEIEPVFWEDQNLDGKAMFWHSSAHLLGNAIELHFEKVLLRDGPAILPSARSGVQEGFFYDFWSPSAVTPDDFAPIESLMMELAKKKRKFEFLEISTDVAQQMFCYNPFKLDILSQIASRGERVTVYRCGDFIDLCRGPHIPNTGRVAWMRIHLASDAGAKIEDKDVSVHRMYGISFPSEAEGKEWQKIKDEEGQRHHRVLGQKQNLFMFSDMSPGNAFFLPDGAHVYNRLMEMLRLQYRERGYEEVMTPVMFQKSLWKTSGHYENYKEDMYFIESQEEGEEEMGLKPMNCPSHCLIYAHMKRSHRELPIRFADFGILHRNEASGSLSGLTRLRKFQQDDAHIFCKMNQVEEEITSCLEFLKFVYRKLEFGDKFFLRLGTRPEKHVGELKLWDQAENTLKSVLEKFGNPYTIEEGCNIFFLHYILTISRSHRRG